MSPNITHQTKVLHCSLPMDHITIEGTEKSIEYDTCLHALICFERHRAGGHSFGGPLPENSLEALRDLISRDNGDAGPLPKLAYVEWDVHVSIVRCSGLCHLCCCCVPNNGILPDNGIKGMSM